MEYLNFLDKNASSEIKNRGFKIFQQNRVEQIDSVVDDEFMEFIVIGDTAQYSISIDISYEYDDDIMVYCNCPYSYKGHIVCKHIAAVLYYLSAQSKNKTTKNKTKRNSSDYLSYGDIDKFDINTLSFNEGLLGKKIDLEIAKYMPGNCVFKLSNKQDYWYYQKPDYIIDFIIEGNELKSKCTCKSDVYGMCQHEASVVNKLKEIMPSFFQSVLIPEKYQDRLKRYAEDQKLSPEIVADMVTLKIFNNKIFIVPLERFILLSESMMKDYITNSSKENKKQTIVKLEEAKIESKRAVGAVIKGLDFVNFFSVSANINKAETSLSSSFEIIEHPENRTLLNNPISDISEFIRTSKLLYFLLMEKQIQEEQVFNQYEILFDLLTNFRFVYIDDSGQKFTRGYTYQNIKYGENEKIVKHRLLQVNIKTDRLKVKYKLKINGDFLILEPWIYTDTGFEKLITEKTIPQYFFYLEHLDLYLFNSISDYSSYEQAIESGSIKTSKHNFKAFVENVISPMSAYEKIDFTEFKNYHENQMQGQQLNVYLSDIEGFVLFTPEVVYNNETKLNPLKYNDVIAFGDDEIIHNNLRDLEFESKFLNVLKDIQPLWKEQSDSNSFFMPIKLMMDKLWFLNAYEKMVKNGINVHGLAKLKHFKYKPYRATINTHISSGQDWFDIKLEVKFGDFTVKLTDVIKAVKNKNNFILLSDGSYGILPDEWIEKFEKYIRAGEVSKDNIRISKLKFNIVEKLFENIDNDEIISEIAEKKSKLLSFREIKDTAVPQGINANLRDYQKEGLNWLNFLHEFGWGGILADDMGLGKTLQIICFLKQIEKESKLPHLIVVPTTLIFNWEAEFAKFSPDTDIYFYYGLSRNKDMGVLKKQNIIITSYGTLTNDIELFASIKFGYIILDESQAIKNPTSLRYKAVCSLKAKNRIACTGTPIENNTFDLYAQCNFLNPGFFGSQAAFKEEYSIPIDKNKDTDVAKELQELINPFVLRRTKEQVVKELPPKTEDILYCSMDDEQMKVYQAYRNKYRDYLLDKIDEHGVEKSKMYVLEGLLKLRQICDSPALLSDEEDYGSQSVKIKELLRHVGTKTGNHKILVFSQFVGMLSLIRKSLEENNIKYEYLDGKCSKIQRQKSVDNFQSNSDVRVFLISLKAGGFGLNLTAADYVYVVDPWWNPAVENQAIDRCYRIGQDKKVFAYRMICKDTVEEKIMKYQASKREIAENIIQTDESVLKKINKEQIIDLFS